MKVTIKDVASQCGVSVATVSRVINNSELVAGDTKEKVMKAIDELGFIPNTLARGLSTKKSNTIGAIVPNIANPFFGEIIEGVEQIASERNYNIIIINSGYNREKVFKDIMVLRGREVDGIIMSSADVDEKSLDALYNDRFPFVLTGPVDYRYPVNYVSVDNEEGTRIAVEHLIKLGHKRIGYISSGKDNYIDLLRFEGYKKALTLHKLPIDPNIYFYEHPQKEVKKMKNMDQASRPTALFAFNDHIALDYMEALERNDIKIPDEMAIVGFDNIKMASHYAINLTTVDNRQIEFGRMATEMLLDMIDGDRAKTQQIIRTPQLVVRRSCGAGK